MLAPRVCVCVCGKRLKNRQLEHLKDRRESKEISEKTSPRDRKKIRGNEYSTVERKPL